MPSLTVTTQTYVNGTVTVGGTAGGQVTAVLKHNGVPIDTRTAVPDGASGGWSISFPNCTESTYTVDCSAGGKLITVTVNQT